jgi:hypothetical protein
MSLRIKALWNDVLGTSELKRRGHEMATWVLRPVTFRVKILAQ